MAEAKSNIQNQKAGILVLKDKNEVSYLAYDTLEMNDWMGNQNKKREKLTM